MKRTFEFSWGTKPLGQPWQSIGLGLVGLICSTLAVYSYISTSRFLASSIQVPGVVIQVVPKKQHYYPVVVYKDKAFNEHTFYSSVGSSPPRFEINQSVTVAYDPVHPDNVKIVEFTSLWLMTFITGILGFLFLCVSVLMWVFRRQIYSLAGYPELSGSGDRSNK